MKPYTILTRLLFTFGLICLPILAAAQNDELDEALRNAEEIRGEDSSKEEFETTAEYRNRLEAYSERDYTILLDIRLGTYDADAETYLALVSREDFLDVCLAELPMPRNAARNAKAGLSEARGLVRIRNGRARLEAVWVEWDGRRWYFDGVWAPSAELAGHREAVYGIAFSPDGKAIATASLDDTAMIWNPATGKQLGLVTDRSDINRVAFSPDGRLLVTASDDKTAKVWDVDAGRLRYTCLHQQPIYAVAFSPASRILATGSNDGTAKLWNMETGALRTTLLHRSEVNGVAFSPDGTLVATASADGTAKLWNVATGIAVTTYFHRGIIFSVAFSADGKTVITASNDGSARIWDVKSGRLKATLAHSSYVNHAVLSPDGRFAATASEDRTAKLWDAETGDLLFTFRHDKKVYWVEFSADGRTLGTASADHTARLWDVRTGALVCTFTHDDEVNRVIFSPDGSMVATASDDATARVWKRLSGEPSESTETKPDEEVRADKPVTSAVSTSAPEPTPPPSNGLTATAPKTFALLVGVSEYKNHPSLINPVPDVEAVEKELREAYGCETSLLRSPTRQEFLTSLRALADRTYGKDDQLLVYFSGHGWFDEKVKRGYLALKDSRPLRDDPLRDSYVSHEDVRAVLERLDCRHVLLVLDSCFSGAVDPQIAIGGDARPISDLYDAVPRGEYVRRKLAFQTRRFITAGGKEYVPDGRPGQHSPFTRRFLAALRSYGGSDGILTLEEILIELERATPQPRAGELLGNEPGSSFLLVARPMGSQEESSETK